MLKSTVTAEPSTQASHPHVSHDAQRCFGHSSFGVFLLEDPDIEEQKQSIPIAPVQTSDSQTLLK